MVGNIEKRGENSYRLRVSSGYSGEWKRITYKKIIQAKNKTEAQKELALFISEIETGQALSSKTILKHHRLLHSMLQQAVYWQMIPYNPALRVRPPKARKPNINFYDDV